MYDVVNDSRAASGSSAHVRHARMVRQTAVLMSRRGDVWQTDLADISATGARLSRPAGWQGELGDTWVLDMLFSDDVNVHVMAEVVRVGAACIGFEFVRIPEETQQLLWAQLGGYADTLEPWDQNIDPAA